MERHKKIAHLWYTTTFLVTLISIPEADSATIQNIFTPNSPLTRLPRDSRYSATSSDKVLQPEQSPEARENSPSSPLGKRCVRCETGYQDDSRYRYDTGRRYYDRYDDRSRDRYPERDLYDRYDRYSDRERYPEEDRYPDRYGDRGRYPERDRYGTGSRDRYRDRYSDYPDRYDPYEYRDRFDKYDRYSDRGVGYDNRGYDYRGGEREGYRPWDETYRGSSGFDSAGKGYYFASGRPEYGASSGYGSYGGGGGGGGGGYASGWNYGGGGGGGVRDDYYRDRGNVSGYRPSRDPYDGYRTTSYLYGRPSTTTSKPPNGDSNSSQDNSSPQDNSG